METVITLGIVAVAGMVTLAAIVAIVFGKDFSARVSRKQFDIQSGKQK